MNTKKINIIRYLFPLMILGLLSAKCGDGGGDPIPIPPATTPPSVPTNVSAAATSSTSIAVTWSSVSNADSYEVYYQTGSLDITRLTTVTQNSYTHTSLQPNTAYNYYVKAKNSLGTSDYSSRASATTLLNDAGGTKPAAPTGVTASAISSNSIRITWNPVVSATSYDVHYTVGSSSAAMNFAGTVASPPYTHNGAQANTTYYYFIKAKNSAGESPLSSYASARISNDIPQAPSGVAASTISSTSIRVTWNPVSGAASYDVHYAVGSSSAAKTLAGSVTDSSFSHTGLQMNTSYFYFIKAKNSAGISDFSSAATARTGISAPEAPTGVTANTQSSSSIRVTWNLVTGASSYDAYYETGSSTNRLLIDNFIGSSFTHIGLEPNTTYRYYIKAKNSAGVSDFSSVATARTDESIPAVPTGVTVTVQSASSILITWNTVSNATSYRVYYRVGSSSSTLFLAGTVNNPSFLHTNLEPNTTYRYYITAKNNVGESDLSTVRTATTSTDDNTATSQLPTPTVTAKAEQGMRIRVTWTLVSGATSYDVYYEIVPSTTKILLANNRSQSDSSYLHLQLQSGTTYRYYVKAKNSSGESNYSLPALATASRNGD